MKNEAVRIRSYAKINLSLEAGALQDDGYHPITTIFQSISLHDTIHLKLLAGSEWHIAANWPELPTDERNLAIQALDVFRQRTGINLGCEITITKRIPLSAGLGGGSSNAAAVLSALNTLHNRPLTTEELAEAAADLGADVPYFLFGGTARGTGRGDELTPLPDEENRELVLVKPAFGVSAAEAYGAFDQLASAGHNFEENAGPFRNDLEAGVFAKHPLLLSIRDSLLSHGASAAFMCGSGSTLCGICPDSLSADTLASRPDFKDYSVWRSRFVSKEEYVRETTVKA